MYNIYISFYSDFVHSLHLFILFGYSEINEVRKGKKYAVKYVVKVIKVSLRREERQEQDCFTKEGRQ